METFAKTNVSYMRIWHYRLRKARVKMYYANAKEKHVSGLCGAAVERKTLSFPHRKHCTDIFKSRYIFVMAGSVDQHAFFSFMADFNAAILPTRQTSSRMEGYI